MKMELINKVISFILKNYDNIGLIISILCMVFGLFKSKCRCKIIDKIDILVDLAETLYKASKSGGSKTKYVLQQLKNNSFLNSLFSEKEKINIIEKNVSYKNKGFKALNDSMEKPLDQNKDR